MLGAATTLGWRRRVDGRASGANTAGVALGVGFCLVTEWREPQGIVLIILFAAAALACLGIRTAWAS
jgi:hypothetical protein